MHKPRVHTDPIIEDLDRQGLPPAGTVTDILIPPPIRNTMPQVSHETIGVEMEVRRHHVAPGTPAVGLIPLVQS